VIDSRQEQAADDDEAEHDGGRDIAHPSVEWQTPQRLPRHDRQALHGRLRQRPEGCEDEQQHGDAGEQAQAQG